MPGDEAITRWLRQLESGDQDAARLLWQRYYQELVELARARLSSTPRRIVDEEDVALSVLRCLYDGAVRGQFTTLENRQELWQLLGAITVRKVIDHQRLLNQQKRGGGTVRGDSVFQGNGTDRASAGFDELIAEAATPETLAIAAEEYQRLMSLLDDDCLRQVAQCKLEGYTIEEIGERLGLARRSIERKLHRIRLVWECEIQP